MSITSYTRFTMSFREDITSASGAGWSSLMRTWEATVPAYTSARLLWIWYTETFQGCNAPVIWKTGEQTLWYVISLSAHLDANEAPPMRRIPSQSEWRKHQFRSCSEVATLRSVFMQGELFLLPHFTRELQDSNTKLREVWGCMGDLKRLGRRMKPRKIRKKPLWLVMLKHQNLNRQIIL